MNIRKLAVYFAPFLANSLLRVIGIPLTTYILGPEEFGLFALMMGVVNICTVLASSVTGYVINHHFKPGEIAPNRLVATLAALEIGMGMLLTAICFAGWSAFARWMDITGDVSPLGFFALLLSVPLGAFWTSGSMMIIYDGRSKLYSTTLIGQGAVQLAASLFALYILGWHVGALIVGQVMGTVTAAVGGYVGLRRHLSFGIDRAVVRESFLLLPWSMVSGFANSATDLMERLVLGRVVSTYALGLYVHSQNYRAMFGTAGKAFSQILSPTMMREAHEGRTDFEETRKGWNIVFVMFTLLGIGFALLGREVIGLLTHGKFIDAAIFVPFWCIFLLFQYVGRPQTAMMYANGQGKRMSTALFIGKLVSGVLMLVLGFPYHAFGLVVAVLTGELVNRILLQFWTYKLWKLSFQDHYALVGAVLIVATTASVYMVPMPLSVRIAMFGVANVAGLLLIGTSAWKFLFGKEGALNA